MQEGLRNRIEAAGSLPAELAVASQRIHAAASLPAFYERRTYRPTWSDGNRPLPIATALLEAIRGAERDGLRASDYHLAPIEKILADTASLSPRELTTSALIDLDLLLTDAFLIYASHLLSGRVDPVALDPLWIANRRERDMVEVLERALETGRIAASLEELLPPYEGYRRLRDELSRHRRVVAAGGWPAIPDGPQLSRGATDPPSAPGRHDAPRSGPFGGC